METSGSIHDALCEDSLSEILVRLPSKSVLRCRAVCKTWHRVTTDRSFLAAHAARRPRQMLVVNKSLTVSAVPLSLDPKPDDDMGRRGYLYDATTTDKDGMFHNLASLLTSLDGLILLRQGPGLFTVCNPITRQWCNLPAMSPKPCAFVHACGFYFHRPSGEYLLLCHGVISVEATDGEPSWLLPNLENYYYILSAGVPVPRQLARAPTERPLQRDYEHPAAYSEILHWCSSRPEATRTGKMLAFHTVAEKFSLMPRPPCDMPMGLLELDGALCAVAMQGATLLNVWVLQDYKSERWMLRNQLLVQPTKSLSDELMSMAISDRGDAILILHPGSTNLVTLCDLKEKKVLKQIYFISYPKLVAFSESLVPHGFFDSRICSEPGPLKFCN